MIDTHQCVLVVGATGMLGRKIADALQRRGVRELRLLVRPAKLDDTDERRKLDPLTATGAVIVPGDLADPASLDAATKGVDVIVSAVQGSDRIIVDGQKALLDAALRNKVRRILPSDFAIDLFEVAEGDHPLLDIRRRFDAMAAASGIEHVHVLNGVFTEYLLHPAMGSFDAKARELTFWGDGGQAIDTTTTDDTAAYTAAAALDRDLPSGKFSIAGDQLTMHEAAATLGEVTGHPVAPRSLGTLDELRTIVDAAKKEVTSETGDPSRFAPFYQLAMFSGVAKLRDIQNARYPDIHPASVRDVMRRQQETG